jgi:hypothetical protein
VEKKATVVQRAIPLSSPAEWKQALSGIPHSFFHTWEHSYAMHLTHKLPAYLYCAESDGVRVVCPFIERPFGEYVDIATPYGFSGFAGNGVLPGLAENWRSFAVGRKYLTAYVNQHPLFAENVQFGEEELFRQKDLYFLNLRSTEEDLLSRCSRRRRRELRDWHGVAELVQDRKALTTFILAQYRDFYLRKEASPEYGFGLATMDYLLGLENVLLLGAARKGIIEAACVVACTRFVAEGLFNYSLPGAQVHGVGLIWQAAKELRQLGLPLFNLGGGISANDNLALFKSRFGPDSLPLFSVKQVFDTHSYTQLCRQVGADVENRRGYFPAFRSSRLQTCRDKLSTQFEPTVNILEQG